MAKIQGDFLVGVFDDDDVIMHAIPEIREKGIKIFEVYSPYPIHGVDDVLGIKRSRLTKAAFMFGLTGTILALTMQFWMLGFDWPMNIGGKAHTPFPTFVPVTFELTVLLASFGMVGTFLVVSDLKPYGKPVVFDPRSTDDKFILVVELQKNKMSADEISAVLKQQGAIEVNLKTIA
jgi:hypothetical protein